MKITYRELLHKVCQFANILRSQGTQLGNRSTGYWEGIWPRVWR